MELFEGEVEMLKKIIVLILSAFLLALAGCSEPEEPDDVQEGKTLTILASNKMIQDMVKTISGDLHVSSVIVENESVLDNFNENDIVVEDEKLDIFFHFGASYEPFSGKLSEVMRKNQVSVIDISRGVHLLGYKPADSQIDKVNPYYLSSPSNYITAISNIAFGLMEKDPFRSDLYNKNLADEKKRIEEIEDWIEKANLGSSDIVYVAAGSELRYLLNSFDVKHITLDDFKKGFLNETDAAVIFIYTKDAEYENATELIGNSKAIPLKVILNDYSMDRKEIYLENLKRFRQAIAAIYEKDAPSDESLLPYRMEKVPEEK
jgi:ABC-type Zn uptake system ZnuABC Zn-binding protein ZnuA